MILLHTFLTAILFLQHTRHAFCSPFPNDEITSEEAQKEPVALYDFLRGRDQEEADTGLHTRQSIEAEEENDASILSPQLIERDENDYEDGECKAELQKEPVGSNELFTRKDTLLNMLQRRQYVMDDEDEECDREFSGRYTKYNSWLSICDAKNPGRRAVSCRPWKPRGIRNDIVNRRFLIINCPPNFTCMQRPLTETRWGDFTQRTACVPSRNIVKIVFGAREIGEKCGTGYYASAGSGKNIRAHLFSWSDVTGLYTPMKNMYLKINTAYESAANDVSDWTTTYDGLTASDEVQFCAYPFAYNYERTLAGQISFI